MRAWRLHQPKAPLSLEDIPMPSPGRGEVLIKVEACGICHTDLHLIDGEWPLPRLPLVLGHEVVGTVTAAAPDVESVAVGQRVGVPWIQYTCGVCEYCLSGHENSCSRQIITGYSADGGYAEYMRAPASHVMSVPERLSPAEAAPVFCAGVTTYRALRLSGINLGDRVAIFGVGGLGQMAVQLARLLGATVIAVDVADDKLERARQLGADVTIQAGSEDVTAGLQRLGGVHAAINMTASGRAVQQALASLRREGTLVVVGFPVESLSLSMYDLVRRRLRVIGSGVGTRQDLRAVLALAGQGRLQVHVEEHPLAEAPALLERLRQGRIPGRAVLMP